MPTLPRRLFGSAPRAGAAPVSGILPATSLPLKLTGILASSDPRQSLAVVLYQGRQASYAQGDKLPVANARIRQITADGVVLEEANGTTLLRYSTSGASAGKRQIPADLPRQLTRHPAEIADYLTVAPVRGDNGLSGYRINPGRKPELFSTLGFVANDLAVAINGTDLRDEQQARQMLLQLPQLRALTVSVERDGQRHDIFVSLDEGSL